jgi:glutamate:GABA antiporter
MDSGICTVTTRAAFAEKKKLRKALRVFDMICFSTAAIIGLDTLGAFAANGAQALTWLLFSAVTFVLPYGLLTAELGSAFPQDGHERVHPPG